jgi:Uma2 family endonuclease
VYQPDIVFISNNQKEKIKQNGFYGAPELVIEILSPQPPVMIWEKRKAYMKNME